MKLKNFEYCDAYRFRLLFENGETVDTDLKKLISDYVELDSLKTARIDTEWGCLEFNGGMVDIEPNTLYQFAKSD